MANQGVNVQTSFVTNAPALRCSYKLTCLGLSVATCSSKVSEGKPLKNVNADCRRRHGAVHIQTTRSDRKCAAYHRCILQDASTELSMVKPNVLKASFDSKLFGEKGVLLGLRHSSMGSRDKSWRRGKPALNGIRLVAHLKM